MGNRDFKQEFLNKSDQCLNGSGILMSLTHSVLMEDSIWLTPHYRFIDTTRHFLKYFRKRLISAIAEDSNFAGFWRLCICYVYFYMFFLVSGVICFIIYIIYI